MYNDIRTTEGVKWLGILPGRGFPFFCQVTELTGGLAST